MRRLHCAGNHERKRKKEFNGILFIFVLYVEKSANRNGSNAEYKPRAFLLQGEFKEQAEIGKEKEKEKERERCYPEALPLFISSSL